MTEPSKAGLLKGHQLPLKGIMPQKKPSSYRQRQLESRRQRMANKERLKSLPFTEAEESVRY